MAELHRRRDPVDVEGERMGVELRHGLVNGGREVRGLARTCPVAGAGSGQPGQGAVERRGPSGELVRGWERGRIRVQGTDAVRVALRQLEPDPGRRSVRSDVPAIDPERQAQVLHVGGVGGEVVRREVDAGAGQPVAACLDRPGERRPMGGIADGQASEQRTDGSNLGTVQVRFGMADPPHVHDEQGAMRPGRGRSHAAVLDLRPEQFSEQQQGVRRRRPAGRIDPGDEHADRATGGLGPILEHRQVPARRRVDDHRGDVGGTGCLREGGLERGAGR